MCTALLLNEIYLHIKFQVSSLNSFWVMLWTKFKNENEQRAITPKVWNFELWFLCTALLLNEIYLPMKFHVDALHNFKVMLRTKKGRTDRQTDGRVNHYMPLFRGIKTISEWFKHHSELMLRSVKLNILGFYHCVFAYPSVQKHIWTSTL